MVTAINPISYPDFILPVGASGTGNTINEAVTNDSAGSIAAFEKILAFRNQERQAASAKLPVADARQPAPADASLSDTALLNLSPQTLNVLNGVRQSVDITAEMAFEASNAEANVVPTQQQLSSILAPFANAPFNDNTFIQIQDAITAAGINPEQISLQEVLNALTPFSLISGEILTNDSAELLAA